jgi:hypothetical protein
MLFSLFIVLGKNEWILDFGFWFLLMLRRLGSVAGPVIQATGRSEFEDDLGSGVTFCRATHIT